MKFKYIFFSLCILVMPLLNAVKRDLSTGALILQLKEAPVANNDGVICYGPDRFDYGRLEPLLPTPSDYHTWFKFDDRRNQIPPHAATQNKRGPSLIQSHNRSLRTPFRKKRPSFLNRFIYPLVGFSSLIMGLTLLYKKRVKTPDDLISHGGALTGIGSCLLGNYLFS